MVRGGDLMMDIGEYRVFADGHLVGEMGVEGNGSWNTALTTFKPRVFEYVNKDPAGRSFTHNLSAGTILPTSTSGE
jgi:hypothetical protein